MADVVLFHHVQGLTDGVRAFARGLAEGGHTVHTPDLYDGQVAADLQGGFALKDGIGDDELAARIDRGLTGLPDELVYAGMSWGVLTAQRLAQTRPSARGVLLYESCLPVTGQWAVAPWPHGLPVQIHGMDDDEFFAHEGDVDAAREIVAQVGPGLGELFTYPGDGHLFLDSTTATHDATATALVLERSRAFLARL